MTNHYQKAGELFGLLRKSLEFGELVMFASAMDVIHFAWEVKDSDGRFRCERLISGQELECLVSLESFAEHLAYKWKKENRKKNEGKSF